MVPQGADIVAVSLGSSSDLKPNKQNNEESGFLGGLLYSSHRFFNRILRMNSSRGWKRF